MIEHYVEAEQFEAHVSVIVPWLIDVVVVAELLLHGEQSLSDAVTYFLL